MRPPSGNGSWWKWQTSRLIPRPYQEKRDLLWNGLTRMGYEVTKPQGTFYMFPKAPIADDLAFVRSLMDEGILAVPGTGFGRSGYIRLSLTIPRGSIERACPDSSAPCVARELALRGP